MQRRSISCRGRGNSSKVLRSCMVRHREHLVGDHKSIGIRVTPLLSRTSPRDHCYLVKAQFSTLANKTAMTSVPPSSGAHLNLCGQVSTHYLPELVLFKPNRQMINVACLVSPPGKEESLLVEPLLVVGLLTLKIIVMKKYYLHYSYSMTRRFGLWTECAAVLQVTKRNMFLAAQEDFYLAHSVRHSIHHSPVDHECFWNQSQKLMLLTFLCQWMSA